jgi:Rod binding domain-containing protein
MPGNTIDPTQLFLQRLEEQKGSYQIAQQQASRARQKLRRAAQDFEAIFIKNLLSQMRKSAIGDSPLFGKSQQAQFYQDMMDEAVAGHLSRAGGLGLGKILFKKVEPTLPPEPEAILREALTKLSG